MTPFDAAHQILSEVDTLDVDTIKAAVTAALLVADAADDLPVDTTSISVTVSKRAKKRLGQCKYRRVPTGPRGEVEIIPFEINISLIGAALAPRSELADTIAHEVAHAVAGAKENHGREWAAIARRYGATPTPCSTDDSTERAWRYAYYCAHCVKVTGRQPGRPKYRRRCSTCHELVATVDLREREIVEGHSLKVQHRSQTKTFARKMEPVIADFCEAKSAITTLAKTA